MRVGVGPWRRLDTRSRPVVGRIVAAAAGTERRRLPVVVGIPVLFAVLVDRTANFGVGVLFVAAGFAAFLHARPTAQETLAAACYGGGAVLLGLSLLELYLNAAQGSTDQLLGTVRRVLWRAVTGASLLEIGLWVRSEAASMTPAGSHTAPLIVLRPNAGT